MPEVMEKPEAAGQGLDVALEMRGISKSYPGVRALECMRL